MKHTATIDYHGVPLVCEFCYQRGYPGSHIDPPEPEMAEVSSVKAGNVEIVDVFTEDQLWEIGDACVEWVNTAEDIARDQAADMLREERALGH
jgi:hypothetical protein